MPCKLGSYDMTFQYFGVVDGMRFFGLVVGGLAIVHVIPEG
jgi:hypothetical protein